MARRGFSLLGTGRFRGGSGTLTSRRSLTFLAGTEDIQQTRSSTLQRLIQNVDAADKRAGTETYVHRRGLYFEFIPAGVGRPRQVVVPDPTNHPAAAHELQHAYDHLNGVSDTATLEQLERRALQTQLKVGDELGQDQGFDNAELRAKTHAQVKKRP